MYFLDEMSWDEMGAIIKARNETELATIKRTWEQTRTICFYNIIAMHGTKDYKKPQDLFQLEWEKPEKVKSNVKTKEDAIERHRQIKLNKYKMK